MRLSRASPRADGFGAVGGVLTARLESHVDRPLVVALSGGGDSIALLRLAADWARANGRRLLALTVDHGLNPDSPAWSRLAREAARAAGADWRELRWDGPKPATGLPAAARRARHALLAEAAREGGARVILFGHTADDIAEAAVMRAEGSTLGALREWTPSPAWPEGRGLMLLRPMLGLGRAEIREWLAGEEAKWVEDPANDDPKFARSRARAFLHPMGGGSHGEATTGGAQRRARAGSVSRREPPLQSVTRLAEKADDRPSPFRARTTADAVRSSPLPIGEGAVEVDRGVPAHALAAVLVCAGGADAPPRGDRLDRIQARLQAGEDFTAPLVGARIEASGACVFITREAGEFARRPSPPTPLTPGVEAVWDGRWAVAVDEPGWSVAPAAGRRARLSKSDRAWLDALPAAARGGQPVLIRDGGDGAVLASAIGRAKSLVEQRLALALDTTPHERDLS